MILKAKNYAANVMSKTTWTSNIKTHLFQPAFPSHKQLTPMLPI